MTKTTKNEKVKDERLKDKEWRIEHLYRIKNKDSEKITFKKNKAQRHFAKNKAKRNIILKARQLGYTTFEAIDMLDDSLFTPNFEGIILSYDQQSALDIFDNKIDFAWMNFPLKNLYKVTTDRANKLTFNFGDDSTSSISVKTSGRSGTFNRVHVSEFGKICKVYPNKAKEIITGTIPSVPIYGRVDIESTAEGEYGDFYEMFWEAYNRGEPTMPTEYKAHFYNWTWDEEEIGRIDESNIRAFMEHPDYILFEDYQKKHKLSDREITAYYIKWLSVNKDWSKLRQEFPTTPGEAFISSGNKLFDSDALAANEIREGKREGDWTIYDEYTIFGRYAMGVDVAEGVGQDSSTAVIIDFASEIPKVAAEFCSKKIDPTLLAHQLAIMGRRYGNCLIAVESNNHGFSTISKLRELYHNVYKGVDPSKKIEFKRKRKSVGTMRYGWHTTKASKPNMLYDLNDAINNQELEIPSKEIIHELRTYDQEDLDQVVFDEKQSKHWDRVIALAICWQMKSKLRGSSTTFYTPKKEKF